MLVEGIVMKIHPRPERFERLPSRGGFVCEKWKVFAMADRGRLHPLLSLHRAVRAHQFRPSPHHLVWLWAENGYVVEATWLVSGSHRVRIHRRLLFPAL